VASWVKKDYLPAAVACCAGNWRFESQPWHYSRRMFSSEQVTGKIFSAEYAVNSKFIFRISSRGEAANYRPYASPSFEVASHVI